MDEEANSYAMAWLKGTVTVWTVIITHLGIAVAIKVSL